MIYPNFDVGQRFREGIKHSTLAFPTLGQMGTQVIRRTGRAWLSVLLPQTQSSAQQNRCMGFSQSACLEASSNSFKFQGKGWSLNCNSNGEKQLLGHLSLKTLYIFRLCLKLKLKVRTYKAAKEFKLSWLWNFNSWIYISVPSLF